MGGPAGGGIGAGAESDHGDAVHRDEAGSDGDVVDRHGSCRVRILYGHGPVTEWASLAVVVAVLAFLWSLSRDVRAMPGWHRVDDRRSLALSDWKSPNKGNDFV